MISKLLEKVFWSAENQIEEHKVMELFQESSTDENLDWRFSSVEIPINQPTKGNVRFFKIITERN